MKQDGQQFIATLAGLFESMTNTNTSTAAKEALGTSSDSFKVDIDLLDVENIDFEQISKLQNGALISTPDTVVEDLDRYKLVVIASDGLFDVMKNEDIITFIHERMDTKNGNADVNAVASALTNHAKKLGSVDNISVVILLLD